MSTMAQVHRFRGAVAAHLGDGPTVYLTPKEAASLSSALRLACKDIKDHPNFGDSQFQTVRISIKDQT